MFFVLAYECQLGSQTRHTEWATTYLVKSNVEVEGGGVIKQRCYESHTGTAAPKNTARCSEKSLVERQDEESEQTTIQSCMGVAALVTL